MYVCMYIYIFIHLCIYRCAYMYISLNKDIIRGAYVGNTRSEEKNTILYSDLASKWNIISY